MNDRVVVVGAGIAGLAAAHSLRGAEPSLEVTVVEAAEAPGGKIASVPVGDLELEAGPDSFVARKPWAADLCRELGVELVAPGASGAYVWTDRGLVGLLDTALGIPADTGSLLRWPGMSRRGRARALADIVRRPRRADGDESIGSLVRRRLGDEAAEVLVDPLLGGLHAGRIDGLGVLATFPELAEWERARGSLIRGAKAATGAASGAGPMFVKPIGGTSRLVDALVAAVGRDRVRMATAASSIQEEGVGLVVSTSAGDFSANAVVVTTPPFVCADLLSSLSPAATAQLSGIRCASTGVVLLVYPEGTGAALPDATGFVVPAGRAPMTACTFVSRKWPSPSFGGRAVLRCFVGGVGAEEVLDSPDEEIVEALCRHLAAVLELPSAAQASAVVQWPRAMPQYGVGHLERVAGIERALPPGIFVAGAAYRGIGVADCVRQGAEAADRVLAHLSGRTSERERVG